MLQVHRKKVFAFIALCCSLSWVLPAFFYYQGYRWNTSDSFIMLLIYMLMPVISVLISMKLFFKERFREKLGLSFAVNKWWLLSWILPVFLILASVFISLLLPGVHLTEDFSGYIDQYKSIFTSDQITQFKESMEGIPIHPLWIIFPAGILSGVTIGALFAFGEEAGWRGYLFFEFKSLSFWRASFLTGAIWGTWYFPLVLLGYNYPVHHKSGVLFMIIFCILLSPLMGLLRIMGKSIFPVVFFHGIMSALSQTGALFLKGGSDLVNGITGLSGFFVLVLLNLGIYYKYNREIKRLYGK